MQVGIDIQEVAPVKKLMNKIDRVFTEYEIEYIRERGNNSRTIAGLWCAKEAYFKALGTGIQLNKLKEIEIRHDKSGRPYYFEKPSVTLSISHTENYATAVCIIFDSSL